MGDARMKCEKLRNLVKNTPQPKCDAMPKVPWKKSGWNITKMKQMKLNCEGVLEATLNKTKGSTLRKAWQIVAPSSNRDIMTERDFTYQDKPAKYKVGELVEVIWDKEGEWFCMRHGYRIMPLKSPGKGFVVDNILAKNFFFGDMCNCTPMKSYAQMDRELFDCLFFNKVLGKVKITKVEKITIYSDEIMRNWKKLTDKELHQLRKQEGFETLVRMFVYLEKYAGSLKDGKPFWHYTFEWVLE